MLGMSLGTSTHTSTPPWTKVSAPSPAGPKGVGDRVTLQHPPDRSRGLVRRFFPAQFSAPRAKLKTYVANCFESAGRFAFLGFKLTLKRVGNFQNSGADFSANFVIHHLSPVALGTTRPIKLRGLGFSSFAVAPQEPGRIDAALAWPPGALGWEFDYVIACDLIEFAPTIEQPLQFWRDHFLCPPFFIRFTASR